MQRKCSTRKFPRKKKRYSEHEDIRKTVWHHLVVQTFYMLHMCNQLDPRRLKKDFPKFLKMIKGEDRVLIIGTTKDPLNADIKSLCKIYSKIILIPRPDYGSRYSKKTLWSIVWEIMKYVFIMIVCLSSSLVEATDQTARRWSHQCPGPQLSCEDFWWLHSRSHGSSD